MPYQEKSVTQNGKTTQGPGRQNNQQAIGFKEEEMMAG
jgi:hypothetical protein